MIELGQLEKQSHDFAAKNVRIFAISNDDLESATKTQKQFPHLTIIADPQQVMAKALAIIHPGAAPDGTDTNAPTTFLVDRGEVRWMFHPDRFLERLPATDLLAAIDKALPQR